MREIDWNKQEWMERFVSVKVKVIISIQERLEDNFLVCLGLASTKTHQQQNIKLSLFVVICRTVHLFWVSFIYGQLVISYQDIFNTFYLSFSHCSKCNILVQRKAEAPSR